LRKEKGSLQQQLKGLQAVNVKRDRDQVRERDKLQRKHNQEIATIKKEAESAKRKLSRIESSHQPKMEALEEEKEALHKKNETLQGENNTLKEKNHNLSQSVAELQAKIQEQQQLTTSSSSHIVQRLADAKDMKEMGDEVITLNGQLGELQVAKGQLQVENSRLQTRLARSGNMASAVEEANALASGYRELLVDVVDRFHVLDTKLKLH